MPRNTRPEHVAFQELVEEATVVETAPVSRGRTLLTLLAAAVITGLAVTAVAIPPTLAAGAATRAAISGYPAFDRATAVPYRSSSEIR